MTSVAFGKRRFSERIEILYQRPLAGARMGLVGNYNYAAGSNGYFDSRPENVFLGNWKRQNCGLWFRPIA